MTHSKTAAAAACGTALTRLGGELADRGCQSELLPGGSAPWLLVSNPAVRHCRAVVVAASLTTRRPAHEVGGRR